MKVYHLVESYSPLSETFIHDLIESLEKKSITSVIGAFKKINEFRDVKNCRVLKPQKGLSFHFLALRYHLTQNKEGFNYLRYKLYEKSVESEIKEIKPDLIHCHFGTMASLGVEIAHKMKIPCVGSFYGYDISRNLKLSIWTSRYKKVLNKLDAAIGISNHICNKVQRFVDHKKVHLIHLPYPSNNIVNSNPAKRIGSTVNCLFVGRLVEKKSPIELLEAFRIAKTLESNDRLRLTIIGDGPLLEAAQKFTAENELEQAVVFRGAVSNEEVKKELLNTHLYIQHSVTASDGDQEGQGVTLVEASAKGIPVITTNHNGFSDVILDGKSGFLVEEHDTQKMGIIIHKLSLNPMSWQALGDQGVKHISENFNTLIETEKLINIYKSLNLENCK